MPSRQEYGYIVEVLPGESFSEARENIRKGVGWNWRDKVCAFGGKEYVFGCFGSGASGWFRYSGDLIESFSKLKRTVMAVDVEDYNVRHVYVKVIPPRYISLVTGEELEV